MLLLSDWPPPCAGDLRIPEGRLQRDAVESTLSRRPAPVVALELHACYLTAHECLWVRVQGRARPDRHHLPAARLLGSNSPGWRLDPAGGRPRVTPGVLVRGPGRAPRHRAP